MCSSCEVLTINGVLCHETGCPDAWNDVTRECKWCGQSFKPENKLQDCCSHSCEMAYNNLSCNCEECNPDD
jgi:hypothetical protein